MKLTAEHQSNQAAAAAAFAEEYTNCTGKLYYLEEMYDEFTLIPDEPDQIDWLNYVDRVDESAHVGCIQLELLT